MSWLELFLNLFKRKATNLGPPPTSAQMVQDIRDAIPTAIQTQEGLNNLRLVIIRYTKQDAELFNAINSTLPLTAPSQADRFEPLDRTCDAIEDKVSRDEIIGFLKIGEY